MRNAVNANLSLSLLLLLPPLLSHQPPPTTNDRLTHTAASRLGLLLHLDLLALLERVHVRAQDQRVRRLELDVLLR